MGPALFELYSTSYSTSTTRDKLSSAKTSKENPKTKPLLKAKKEVISEPVKPSANMVNSPALKEKRNSLTVDMKPDIPNKAKSGLETIRCYRIKYIGSSVLDRRYTLPM